MGLDMYLNKKVFIGANYEHRGIQGELLIKDKEGNRLDAGLNKLSYLEYQAAYWRKANQIHNWFVNNIQEGRDECQESYVPIDALRELLDLCKTVQADHSKAEELLPSTSGFFFGTTEYDDWYFEDIDNTVSMLTELLEDPDIEKYEFYYQASW